MSFQVEAIFGLMPFWSCWCFLRVMSIEDDSVFGLRPFGDDILGLIPFEDYASLGLRAFQG